jgi:predicted RNA-binding Zn ribbon-like protein
MQSGVRTYLAEKGISLDPELVLPTLDRACQHRGPLRVVRRYERDTPEQWLMPLAESAAQLLAEEDFGLVRKCESSECTLYFYDRTKSHRRRWCSMATRGARHKVSNFRARHDKPADE